MKLKKATRKEKSSMSYWGNLMAEQEADDYLMSLGDGERAELMEDMNNKAKQTCAWETTTETEENEH